MSSMQRVWMRIIEIETILTYKANGKTEGNGDDH